MCHCNERKLSALQIWRPEKNTALNAETEQLITAKISDNTFEQENKTYSVVGLLRQRISQLQKYEAAQ